MLRNSINAISVGCQKNAGQESECVLFFFLNQVVLGLGLGLGLGRGYLGLWLVSTPPHPFLKMSKGSK